MAAKLLLAHAIGEAALMFTMRRRLSFATRSSMRSTFRGALHAFVCFKWPIENAACLADVIDRAPLIFAAYDIAGIGASRMRGGTISFRGIHAVSFSLLLGQLSASPCAASTMI